MAERKKIYIAGMKQCVEVSDGLYKAYNRFENYEKYLRKKDKRGGKTLYCNLDRQGSLGEELLQDKGQPSVEELVEQKMLIESLRTCLAALAEEEQDLIRALFYEGLTERELSLRTGVHNMTIHNRKVRILKKLRKMMK